MRFLGNKTSMLDNIISLLQEQKIVKRNYTFFDAFCGTGSVAEGVKDKYNIIINDLMEWAVVYSYGRISATECQFKLLGFNPFEYLNENAKVKKGFFYKNYSPAESKRMYFTEENAGKIDYFRTEIEEWNKKGKLTNKEYNYLLACLIESVSDVSNTAGVYGAFLKKWDTRAIKPIVFNKVDYNEKKNVGTTRAYNNRIEEIIEKIDCDILYLDPPYTQNQYGTQYHLLETLIKYDAPEISKITGSRSTAPLRSDWSKNIKCHILLDRIVAKTKAKYILFSYNNDGFMSREYIESLFKRYGKEDTFLCKRISYKKYQNWKTEKQEGHEEYLYFVEKKDENEIVYESPLNYIGSKAKVVNLIKKYLPKNKEKLYDIFGGGFNVGVNAPYKKIVYNDINYYVTSIIESLKEIDTYEYISYMYKIINKYDLKKGNDANYRKARNDWNKKKPQSRDARFLLTIILYGFQQQIRFNNNKEFNNPVGVRWFNDKVFEKLVSFSRRIKEIDCKFYSESYENIKIDNNAIVYLDPPYELTNGAYNDGKRGFKGWNKKLESELLNYLDELNRKKIPFMLSYVLNHKNKENKEVRQWISNNNYNCIHLGKIIGISGSRREEILVTNYDKK